MRSGPLTDLELPFIKYAYFNDNLSNRQRGFEQDMGAREPDDPLRKSLVRVAMKIDDWINDDDHGTLEQRMHEGIISCLERYLDNQKVLDDLDSGLEGVLDDQFGNQAFEGGEESGEEDESEGESEETISSSSSGSEDDRSAVQSRKPIASKSAPGKHPTRSKTDVMVAASRHTGAGNATSAVKQPPSSRGKGKRVAVKRSPPAKTGDKRRSPSGKVKSPADSKSPVKKKRRTNARAVVVDPTMGNSDLLKPTKQAAKTADERAARRLQEIFAKGMITKNLDISAGSSSSSSIGPSVEYEFDCNVMEMIQPPAHHLVREPHDDMVTSLVGQMQRRPHAALPPMYIYLPQVATPADFVPSMLGDYVKETIGGNHQRLACRKVLSRLPSGTSHAMISLYTWKKCHLFCGLTDEEVLALGHAHNADQKYILDSCYMDKINIYRNLLYNPGTEVYQDRWQTDDIQERSDGDIKDLSKWKDCCMDAISYSREKVQNHSPALCIARFSQENFETLLKIDKLFENEELLGQTKKKGKKKVIKGQPPKPRRITSANINSFTGLDDNMTASLLNGVLDKSQTLVSAANFAMLEKKKIRMQNAWLILGKCTSVQEAYERFSENVLLRSMAHFQPDFAKDLQPDNMSKGFKEHVAKHLTEWTVREKLKKERAAAAAAAAAATGGDGEGGSSTAAVEEGKADEQPAHYYDYCDTTIPRVYLSSKEYRGKDGSTAEAQTNFTLKECTTVKIRTADILNLNEDDEVALGHHYDLVLIDPPYGCTNEPWDTAWTDEQFKTCVESTMHLNRSVVFALHCFCSAQQLSGFLRVFKELADDESNGCKVYSHHGAWHKEGKWNTRELIYIHPHPFARTNIYSTFTFSSSLMFI